ncbi:hypothetical protein CPAR01_13913 [Colletotrichum paranaense]|uniref:Uncharacterized protein n=2 Tax=Colletotrichum acutatum species complex TaxID=2707335 RepID=A0AAI9UPK6_9PEZI|nr:uncharacterized protein CPAR01_13913 [Colletotrichum paranaense]KAK1462329.1 hypothetical protein CMEL01_14296 [Colletotrichum melonis]KAK1523060.1 hypothetical protein CPAR01_13913 [Colletotrichum paranaense]
MGKPAEPAAIYATKPVTGTRGKSSGTTDQVERPRRQVNSCGSICGKSRETVERREARAFSQARLIKAHHSWAWEPGAATPA